MKPSLSAGDNFQPASRALMFSARPISEIATIGSRALSISSITTSPFNKVGTLNRVIVEQSNLSQGEETEVLKFLRKLKEVEEEREQLLSLAKENEHICSLLTNNKIFLEDYPSAKSLPSNEALSRESNDSSASRIEGKRKCKKGAVASIIETLQGTKSE